MTHQNIKEYLSSQHILENASISEAGSGESNQNHLAESNGTKLIIRASRKDMPGSSKLANEAHFMNFAASQRLSFAPKAIKYDTDLDLLVTEYVEGKDGSVLDLTDIQIPIFVAQLKNINNVSYDAYKEWCIKTNQKPQIVESEDDRFKKNITDRIEFIRLHDDDLSKKVLRWAEWKLEKVLSAKSKVKTSTRFVHGDLRWNEGGGNLRLEDNSVAFIDWELARFVDSVVEIGDVLGSIRRSHINQLLKIFSQYKANETNIENLVNDVIYGILWGKLGNILWVAERYCLLSDAGSNNLERYESLALEGMADGDFFFETDIAKLLACS